MGRFHASVLFRLAWLRQVCTWGSHSKEMTPLLVKVDSKKRQGKYLHHMKRYEWPRLSSHDFMIHVCRKLDFGRRGHDRLRDMCSRKKCKVPLLPFLVIVDACPSYRARALNISQSLEKQSVIPAGEGVYPRPPSILTLLGVGWAPLGTEQDVYPLGTV